MNLDNTIFTIPAKAKSKAIIAMVVGVILLGIGYIGLSSGWSNFDPAASEHGHSAHASKTKSSLVAEHAEGSHEKAHGEAHAEGSHGGHGHGDEFHPFKRIITELWHANVFFLGIAALGVFFYAVNYAAWAGWSVVLTRVFLSLGWFIPVGAIVLVILFALGYHDIFHWTHEGIMTPGDAHYDKIIASKEWYLNMPFYLGRMFVFLAGWIFFWLMLKKETTLEDQNGGTLHHNRSINWSAGFLVFFAVSSSMCSWDWIMSIDTHWFSTLFGWYTFASWFVSAIAVIILVVLFLKDAGYLPQVTSEHLHDLGKFMFAFSIFWTYLFFSQFILYYYSNIPEETIYFIERVFYNDNNYLPLFIANLVLNFLFPFLFLMTRDAKRYSITLKVAACGILLGHWIDTYLMVTPGVLKNHGGLSLGTLFIELGIALIYIGAFALTVMFGLSKLPLVPKNHPMLEESLNHHT